MTDEVLCTCFLVSAWEDPCPRHGAIPGTVAATERPWMGVDDVLTLLREQRLPEAGVAEIRGLHVAPDVYDAIAREFPPSKHALAPLLSWALTVDRFLEPGSVVPVDAHGRPIPRPNVQRSGAGLLPSSDRKEHR